VNLQQKIGDGNKMLEQLPIYRLLCPNTNTVHTSQLCDVI